MSMSTVFRAMSRLFCTCRVCGSAKSGGVQGRTHCSTLSSANRGGQLRRGVCPCTPTTRLSVRDGVTQMNCQLCQRLSTARHENQK